jgi:hypothetical protein
MPGSEYYDTRYCMRDSDCITLLEKRKTPATSTRTKEYSWPTLECILWKYSSDEVGNAIH